MKATVTIRWGTTLFDKGLELQLRCTLAYVAVVLHKATCSNPSFNYLAGFLDMRCSILSYSALRAAVTFHVTLRILHECHRLDSLG